MESEAWDSMKRVRGLLTVAKCFGGPEPGKDRRQYDRAPKPRARESRLSATAPLGRRVARQAMGFVGQRRPPRSLVTGL
jgi:hypothetical protein